MKIQCILREAELNEAIRAYIIKEGYPVEGMDIAINLIKGRTGFGSTRAEVDLVPQGELEKEETMSEIIEDTTASVIEEIANAVDDMIDVVEDKVEDLVDEVKETIEDKVDDAKEFLFSTEQKVEEVKEATVIKNSLFS